MVKERVFIVGCPRSGTTLLQTLLVGHRDVWSLPETHFFTRVKRRGLIRGKLGLRRNQGDVRALFKAIGIPECRFGLSLGIANLSGQFQSFMDTSASRCGKLVWIEKTPSHLHAIGDIEAHISSPKFIHILRNGEDVVASLYEVTHRHPDEWGGASSLRDCCARWVKDVGISLQYLNAKNHLIVSYEKLVNTPHEVMQRVFDFLTLDFDENVFALTNESYEKIREKKASWTAEASREVNIKRERKFDTILDEKQREFVIQKIQGPRLDLIF